MNPRHLTEQARRLAGLEVAGEPTAARRKGRPRQADLRRAISSAYYAVFHLLVTASSKQIIAGRGGGEADLRHVVSRGFDHGGMKRVCVAFAAGAPPGLVAAAVGDVPPTLREVARVFVALQTERHRADYDRTVTYDRSKVTDLIERAEQVINRIVTLKDEPATRAFLLALLIHKTLKA